MTVVLLEATPADPRTGAAAPVRLAGGGYGAYTDGGHLDWLAGIAGAPDFTAGFGVDAGGWTGGAVPAQTTIVFAPADPATVAQLGALYWVDAPATLRTAAAAAPMTGKVVSAALADGVLTLTIADLAAALDKPLLTVRFTGKGGIEGDAAAEGREKRRSWGRCFNVEARPLIVASNVYEVGDPAHPLHAIDAVRDKGRAGAVAIVAWAGDAPATLAALIAAPVPAGGAAVAPSIACVRWWTQPAGPLTVDLRGEVGAGYVETPAAIAARVSAAAGGPAVDALDAAVALRPVAAGVHVAGGDGAAAAIDRVLLGCGLLWLVDGTIRIRPWSFAATGDPVAWRPSAQVSPAWTATAPAGIAWGAAARPEVVRSHGVQRLRSFAPIKARRVGYRRNHRLHDAGEIAADVPAGDIKYADGRTVEFLKPAEPGADITRTLQLSRTSLTIVADYSGVIVGGQLPAYVRASLVRGGVDVSADADFSIVTRGCTATIGTDPASRGLIAITDVAASGGIEVHAALGGGPALVQPITITRTLGAPPSGGGGGASIGIAADVMSVVYDMPAATLDVTTGTGAVTIEATLDYQSVSRLSSTIAAKVQVRGADGLWADISGETVGTTAQGDAGGGYAEPGVLSFVDHYAPALAGPIEVRLMLRRSSGAGASVYGNFVVRP